MSSIGAPAVGVRVTAKDSTLEATTGADGTFTIRALARGGSACRCSNRARASRSACLISDRMKSQSS